MQLTPRNGTLCVKGKILKIRQVGSAARIWGGGFAGKSEVQMDVELVDAASGAAVRRKFLATDTNILAATWSFGASDRSIVSDMGIILAEYLRAIMPTTMP